ncbi:ABC transporter permease [Porticoccaceae bacterium LTM1]|nr:ABC transporter permease [Porticoccaceae bacterium LTM1]
MFKSYLITSLRNLSRHPAYSFINIFGLSLGIASCMVLAALILKMGSTNRSLEGADYIYELQTEQLIDRGWVPQPIHKTHLSLLTANIPELSDAASVEVTPFSIQQNEATINLNAYTAETNFFNIFPINMIQGKKEGVLEAPGHAVISESSAKKLYGDQSPVGKVLQLNKQSSVVINGVYQDYPTDNFLTNCHLITSKDSVQKSTEQIFSPERAFLKLIDRQHLSQIRHQLSLYKLPEANIHHIKDQRVTLEPIITPYRKLFSTANIKGKAQLTYTLAAAALCFIVLFASCINFINLTTARLSQRQLEVGIRRSFGARQSHLLRQFFVETLTLVLISSILSITILILGATWVEHLIGEQIPLEHLLRIDTLIAYAIIIVSVTLLAGTYPGIQISRLKPIESLSRRLSGAGKGMLRKLLVCIQFISATILLTLCLIVQFQVNIFKQINNGIELDNIATLYPGTTETTSLQQEISKLPFITSVTNPIQEIFPPSLSLENAKFDQKIIHDRLVISGVSTGYDSHFGIGLIAGEHFSPHKHHFVEDISNIFKQLPLYDYSGKHIPVIITLAGLELLGYSTDSKNLESLINQEITLSDNKTTFEIIGIADAYPEFITNDLPIISSRIPHFLLFHKPNHVLSIKYHNLTFTELTKQLQPLVNSFTGNLLASFRKEKEEHDKSFQRMSNLIWKIGSFAILAITISLMGIYGLSLFTIERRTKEIGIRKTLGASNGQLSWLLIIDSCKPLVVALAIASPLSFIAGNLLANYFKEIPPIWLFSLVVVPAILLSLSVIFILSHTLQASRANPILALNKE